ncbi:hypothetical protein BC834DRAFT_832444 [Gloeopeniophorella convolvens]|nr:hypothetical protein BC834DRAFT_832444 [Gloeopeniophorella convolvens]
MVLRYALSRAIPRLLPRLQPSTPRARFPRLSTLAANATPEGLSIPSLNTTFPYRWLRDSCSCDSCIHPSTQQKLHRSSDIPTSVIPETVETNADGIYILWAGPDGHRSFFPHNLLTAHTDPAALHAFHHDTPTVSWRTGSALLSVSGKDLDVPYDDLNIPRGLQRAITQLQRTGLLFVTGVPHRDTSDAGCELRKLVALLAELRETFYGAVWDVKNVAGSRNIAYTNLFLGLHMDLQYFESPPRYQILHCLRNHVRGGTSLFVDAFAAAHALRAAHPEDFSRLASTPVPFHYINDARHLHRSHPTISVSSQDDARVVAVSYSPPFQAPLPRDTPDEFYDSLGRFADLVEAPGAVYERQLREGDAVVFDNRRVLHGRTAFKDMPGGAEKGTTNRWLKGCYFEGDVMESRARVLRARMARGEI